MSADWAPGDLALCVQLGCLPFEPQTGAFYLVAAVHREADVVGLEISEVPCWPGYDGWAAGGFVKITPGADIVGIEERRRVPVAA